MKGVVSLGRCMAKTCGTSIRDKRFNNSRNRLGMQKRELRCYAHCVCKENHRLNLTSMNRGVPINRHRHFWGELASLRIGTFYELRIGIGKIFPNFLLKLVYYLLFWWLYSHAALHVLLEIPLPKLSLMYIIILLSRRESVIYIF